MNWFSQDYHTLWHCMRGDLPWLLPLLVVKSLIIVGYCDFALRSWRGYRQLEVKSESAKGLLYLTFVFLACAVCGYSFPLLRVFWPAYRLELFFNIGLLLLTLRLVYLARHASLIDALFMTDDLKDEVRQVRRRLKQLLEERNDAGGDL